MIIYDYHDGFFYEAHLDMSARTIDFILRFRDGHEQRPTRLGWDDLDPREQDNLLTKLRKALKQYDKDSPQSLSDDQ